MLKSIAIKDLTKDLPKDTLFYKVETSDDVLKKYYVKELPSLLFFKQGNFLGNIDGYYEVDNKEELLNNMNKLLK